VSIERSNAGSVGWKTKYLNGLEQQERKEKQLKAMLVLLNQATLRMSMIAEGIDGGLDKQLEGMRSVLKTNPVSAQELKMIVEALGGQVKRMDAIKTSRGQQLAKAFDSLLSQLKQFKPAGDEKKALNDFKKNLKAKSAHTPHHAVLLQEFADLQKTVLSNTEVTAHQTSLWTRLMGSKSESANNTVNEENTTECDDDERVNDESVLQANLLQPAAEELELSDSQDLSDEKVPDLPRVSIAQSLQQEPGFSKINGAVSGILRELLQQIEPPPMAKANHQKAVEQIERGLNWYELIAVLEQVSIVIVSAFDRDQQAFENFLNQLNDRLASAYEAINSSQQSQGDSKKANKSLQVSMREQVAAMQESVVNAHDLEQLKLEVSDRLDKVLSAMSTHQSGEEIRGQDLSSKLNALVEQVKDMEQESKDAEREIETQRQRALRDVLTQLPNREAYNLHLTQEFERWQRYDRPLSLVVCDIDHFKRVNDTYGHQAGDKVLRIIARSIASRLRKTDFIARFGGEEFVVLMPETSAEQAYAVIDHIRESIAECPFHFKEKPVTITLSFGVTAFAGENKPDAVFARADKALYQAKEQGRNRVIIAAL
jgi:diguanylate cyclase